jgi:hypothetical protein
LAAVLSALALGACSVADSFHVDPTAISASSYSAVPMLCRSALGSYALPKSFLKVTAIRNNEGKVKLAIAPPVVRADKSLTFCLDHISDPLADDEIRIIKASGQIDGSYTDGTAADPKIDKNNGTQLLQWVVSNTVDQTEYIARVLIRTAFTALSGKSGFMPLQRSLGPNDVSIVASFEFDPFDPEQSALHNQRLRDFGLCLVLENFTFDTRAMTVEQYCSAPRYEEFPFDVAYARYRSGPPPRIAGVAYRPRVNYALSVYKKDNPNGRGRWRLDQQQQMAFENISPIVSVGLTRSGFAARRVALKFNRGALEAMCLVKTSELQSAVLVPYEIAKSIVALPTQIFEVKIGNISDNVALVSAENDVVAAQKQYLDFLASSGSSSGAALEGAKPDPEIPNPTTISVPKSSIANMEELKSTVLDKICDNAPSVIGGKP